MTFTKAWSHSRRNVSTPVLTVLYRDGFLYFVVSNILLSQPCCIYLTRLVYLSEFFHELDGVVSYSLAFLMFHAETYL